MSLIGDLRTSMTVTSPYAQYSPSVVDEDPCEWPEGYVWDRQMDLYFEARLALIDRPEIRISTSSNLDKELVTLHAEWQEGNTTRGVSHSAIIASLKHWKKPSEVAQEFLGLVCEGLLSLEDQTPETWPVYEA